MSRVSVRAFDSVLAMLVDGVANVCTMGTDCRQYFVVEHNGDVYPCDFFVEKDLLLGNVMSDDWESLAASPAFLEFGRQKSRWNSACDACPHLRLCAGDCLKHRLCGGGDPSRLSLLCDGWKRFYGATMPAFEALAAGIRRERADDGHRRLQAVASGPGCGVRRTQRCPARAAAAESTSTAVDDKSLEAPAGRDVYLVGIKGTGMAALADILVSRGARVVGSDVADTFYTDAILKRLAIPVREGFSAANLPAHVDLVVHSAAYDPATHVEIVEARRRGVPVMSYPQALGGLSRASHFVAISGVHGKSTTTAMAGVLLKELGLPATTLVGTEVPAFGGRSVHSGGDRYLVAESCEYRRHFLNTSPRCIVVTSAEAEHLDYFRDREDVLSAFVELAARLPRGGTLIFCADDEGAAEIAGRVAAARPDCTLVPYGTRAAGEYRIGDVRSGAGELAFTLGGDAYRVGVPGRHNVLNAAAAIAVARYLEKCEGRAPAPAPQVARALWSFRGTRRRSEVIGEAGGVLFLDDYGHHPTEISATLGAFREFYPGRRIVVDFMSHTYSRTQKLLAQLAGSFSAADLVVLHRIYASAREHNPGGVSGTTLYEETRRRHPAVLYFDDPFEAVEPLAARLTSGDLFVTMGAGDNWKAGRALFRRLGGGIA